MHSLTRRTAIGISLGLWARAAEQAHQHGAPAASQQPYSFAFLKPGEIKTVQRFASTLIPATERSGGATAARVEEYVDRVLSVAAPSLQRTWRRGLALWSKEDSPDAVFRRLAPQEFSPKTSQDHFFAAFKNAVTTAFYTSEEGIQKELGYQGLGFLREYKGWEGERFATPADYQPLLRSRS